MTRLNLSLTGPAPKEKSKAAQIAELLPEIEAALAAGHSHQAIFEHVKGTTGLELTFGYYENTLHRIRQRQEAKNREISKPPAASTQQPIPQAVLPFRAEPRNGALTSRLQTILGASDDDFFS